MLDDVLGNGHVLDAQFVAERSGHTGIDDGIYLIFQNQCLSADGGGHLALAADHGDDLTPVQPTLYKFHSADGARFLLGHALLQRADLYLHGSDDAQHNSIILSDCHFEWDYFIRFTGQVQAFDGVCRGERKNSKKF